MLGSSSWHRPHTAWLLFMSVNRPQCTRLMWGYPGVLRRQKRHTKTSRQQWVSKLNWACYKTFPSNLSQTHLLQSHSMLKSLFTAQKRSRWTQAFLQPCSNFPHLSTILYFTTACILLAHRQIQLSTISSSDHLVPQLPWAVYQEQSLSFPAQVSLTTLKEWSGK